MKFPPLKPSWVHEIKPEPKKEPVYKIRPYGSKAAEILGISVRKIRKPIKQISPIHRDSADFDLSDGHE